MGLDNKRLNGVVAVCVLAGGALVLAACGGDDDAGASAAETIELTMASYQPPGSPWRTAYEQWAEDVNEATGGEISIEIFDNESLLPQTDIMPGIASGQADIGFFVNSYHPAELPLSSASEIPFVTHDAQAQMQAFDELYETYEPFREEYTSLGVEIAAFQPATAAVMSSREPVSSPAELDGMQVRAVGYLSEALAEVGALPQTITLGETYEALERGVIDANTTVFENTHKVGLHEVAPHVTDIGTGSFAIAMIGFNADVWNDRIPEEHRDTIRELTKEAGLRALEEFKKAGDEACRAAKDNGGEVQVWGEDVIKDWRDSVYDDLVDKWIETAGQGGAPAAEFYEKYLAALEQKTAESTYEPSVVTCANETGS